VVEITGVLTLNAAGALSVMGAPGAPWSKITGA
jgi:hypothetical protein